MKNTTFLILALFLCVLLYGKKYLIHIAEQEQKAQQNTVKQRPSNEFGLIYIMAEKSKRKNK